MTTVSLYLALFGSLFLKTATECKMSKRPKHWLKLKKVALVAMNKETGNLRISQSQLSKDSLRLKLEQSPAGQ